MMPRTTGGPFDERNEAFARGVLEGESRAGQARSGPRARLPWRAVMVLGALAAVVLLSWMVMSRPSVNQRQDIDIDTGVPAQEPAATHAAEVAPVVTPDADIDQQQSVTSGKSGGDEAGQVEVPAPATGRQAEPQVEPKVAPVDPAPPETQPDPLVDADVSVPDPLPTALPSSLPGVGDVVDGLVVDVEDVAVDVL
jgi:hypothetical protein